MEIVCKDRQSSVSIRIEKDFSLEQLACEWTALFNEADGNIFNSWHWTRCWLKHCAHSPILLKAYCEEELCGLSLWESVQGKHFSLFTPNAVWLGRTGEQKKDQVWIEKNRLLIKKGLKDLVEPVLVDIIQAQLVSHECYVGLSFEKDLQVFKKAFPHARLMMEAPSYSIDLSGMSCLDDYLGKLSKNTRAQIRRSHKLLKQAGSVELIEIAAPSAKENAFNDMANIHIERWRNTDEGSGFENASFIDFHRDFIFSDETNSYSSLFLLTLDAEPLGYIYIMKEADCWNFYLSALQYHEDNRIKIGMLMHTLVIEKAIEAKVSIYDFLASDAQYKQSLTFTPPLNQQLVCFYKSSLIMSVRETLRKLKSSFFSS